MRYKGKKVLGTTHHGKTKVTSKDEIGWLEKNKKPYTRYVYGPKGKRVVKKVRRNSR